MRDLRLDPDPFNVLERLHVADPFAAARLESCLDWIESDPPDPRAKRQRFSNGIWAISLVIRDRGWVILWDEFEAGRPIVRFVNEDTFL